MEPPIIGIAKAMQKMQSRGPDGDGFYQGRGIALGHRRLAIVDINGGSQPWIDEFSSVVLVFNGELYNHNQLRQQLLARGHDFCSRSDTEVLCKAYIEWGRDCLSHLVGMFAFALWDPRQEALFVARDRLGVKPFYYSANNTHFSFASNVAALRELPGISGQLDLHAVSHYLTSVRTTLGDRTLFADIKSLEPGHAMWVCREKPISSWCYWRIPIISSENKLDLDLDVASNRFRELFEEAVDDRLMSDVPLGSFLSGGIDSAAITALATHGRDEAMNTYSVGFERHGYNEWPFVRDAANHLNVNSHEIITAEESYKDSWLHLMSVNGLPLSTPNEVGLYSLAKALQKDCKVALSGEGADEVLGGYSIPYFSALDFDRAAKGGSSGFSAALHRLYGCDAFDSRLQHFQMLNSWVPNIPKWALFHENIGGELAAQDKVSDYYEELLNQTSDSTTMDAYLHVHARVNLEGLLSRVDSSTMAASVEARVPFTDHRLVEFAFSLPDHLKLDWKGEQASELGAEMNVVELNAKGLIDSKRLLRRAFDKDLPKNIVNRPKMSFPTPFLEAFDSTLQDTVGEALRDSPLIDTLFNREAVEAVGKSGNLAIWPVANLCLWSMEESGITI